MATSRIRPCIFILSLIGFAGSLWAQTTLTPSASYVPTDLETGEEGHEFGRAVAMVGDLIVVGAPYADSDATGSLVTNSGKVYVFDRSSATPATPIHVIDNPTPEANDQFGKSVDVDGDTLAIGSLESVSGKAAAGIVYIYDISTATPTQLHTLQDPNAAAGAEFGYSVAVSSSRIAVGCREDSTFGPDRGSAFVFDLSSGTPTAPVWEIHPGTDGNGFTTYSRFGNAIELDGDILAVGASNNRYGSGHVSVYDLSQVTPGAVDASAPRLFLRPPAEVSNTKMGDYIDLSDGRLIVGHHANGDDGSRSGKAYIWNIFSRLPITGLSFPAPDLIISNPDPEVDGFFGAGVAISGSRFHVGASGDDGDGTNIGTGYFYDLESPTPTTPIRIVPNPTPADGDVCSAFAAMNEQVLIVAAIRDDIAGLDSGVLHVFDIGQPDIAVVGNSMDIVSGDDTPTPVDHTDFGSESVQAGAVTHTFTITNEGHAPLSLTGTDPNWVTLAGSNAFSVSDQPASAVLAPGASTAFEVTFDPAAAGAANATVSILTDDPNESPFTFDITGFGLEPVIQIDGAGEIITDGDDTPDEADLTDFGETPVLGGQIVRQFTISNLGDTDLNLTGTAPDLVTIAGSSAFEVTAQPASPIAPAGSQTFEITLDPSAAGEALATVSIANNDPDATPFTFAIKGTGLVPEISVHEFGSDIASGGTLDFGDVPIEGGGQTRVITVANAGLAELSLTGAAGMAVELSGSSAFQLVSQPKERDLAPGAAQYVGVRFDPFGVGPQTAMITIQSNDLGIGQYTVQLTGNGIAGTQAGRVAAFSIPAPHRGTEVGFAGTDALAIDGNLLAVGAPGADTGAENAGEVYLFDLASPTPMNPVMVIANPTPEENDAFGFGVDLDNGKLVVGAPGELRPIGGDDVYWVDDVNPGNGAAYVFDVSGSSPVLLHDLTDASPDKIDSGHRFGETVAISGDWVVVGAPRWDWPFQNTRDAGRVDVFDLLGASPEVAHAQIYIFGSTYPSRFGEVLALDGDVLVVGTPRHRETRRGSAHVYDLSTIPAGTKGNPAKLAELLISPGGNYDYFGHAVAVSGRKVLVGAYGRSGGSPLVSSAGQAFLYDMDAGSPTTPVETFDPVAPEVDGSFGFGVALSGTRAMIGSYLDDTGAVDSGIAGRYDLAHPSTPELPVETFVNPTPGEGDRFGGRLKIGSEYLVISAGKDDSAGTDMGAVYIYAAPPALSVTQGDQIVLEEQTGLLEVNVTGGALPVALQWYRGEVGDTSDPVVGANGASLSVGPLPGGEYPYWLLASNVAGLDATPILTVTVPTKPALTGDLTPSVYSGDLFSYNFSTNISGVDVDIVSQPSWTRTRVGPGLTVTDLYGAAPNTLGVETAEVLLSNTYYQDVPDSISISVLPAPPTVSLGPKPLFQAGRQMFSYAHQVYSTGGGVTYSATGLPDGLAIDETTGLISGSPDDEGTFSVTITVTNSEGTSSVTADMVIGGPYGPPEINSASAVKRMEGETLIFTLSATDDPTLFEVKTALPAWLRLEENLGVWTLSGVVPQPHFLDLEVRATGPGGVGEWTDLQIQVCPLPGAPRITSLSAVNGRVGDGFTFQATADPPATQWAVTDPNALPGGIGMHSSGQMAGTPQNQGTFEAEIVASNAIGRSFPQKFTFHIGPRRMTPEITTTEIIEVRIGEELDYTFEATHSPTSFTITELPDGKVIQDGTSGRITGLFTEDPGAVYRFQVVGTNADGDGEAFIAELRVLPVDGAPEITGLTETGGYAGRSFASAIQATNLPTSYRVIGDLPKGLALDETTGVIGGRAEVYPIAHVLSGLDSNPVSSHTFQIQAVNEIGDGAPVTVRLSFTAAPGTPRILTDLVTVVPGVPLSAQIRTTVDDVTSFTVHDARLPEGIDFDPLTGQFSGTFVGPRTSGFHRIQVSANNSEGIGPGRHIFVGIAGPEVEFGLSSPAFTVGAEANRSIDVTSSVPIQSYLLEDLPNGLTFDPATEKIVGRPLVAGDYWVTITVNTEFGSEDKRVKFHVRPQQGDVELMLPEYIYWGEVGETRVIDFPYRRVGEQERAGFLGDSSTRGEGALSWYSPNFPAEGADFYDRDLDRYRYRATFDRSGTFEVRFRSDIHGFYKRVYLVVGRRELPSGPLITGPQSFRTTFHATPGIQIESENATQSSLFSYQSPVTGQWHSISMEPRSGFPRLRTTIRPERFLLGNQIVTLRAQNDGSKDRPSEFPMLLDVEGRSGEIRMGLSGSRLRSGKVGEAIPLSFFARQYLDGTWHSRSFETLQLWVKNRETGYFEFFTRSNDSGTVEFVSLRPGTFEAMAFGTTAEGETSGSFRIFLTVSNDAGTHAVEGIVPLAGSAAAPPAEQSLNGGGASPPPAQSSSAPVGQVGELYSAQMVFSNEVITVIAEGLPPGLNYDETSGEIGGYPEDPGQFEVTFTAVDGDGNQGVSMHTIEILPAVGAPAFTDTPPVAVAGEPWSWTPALSNEAMTLLAQDLPGWLKLDHATKTVSGTFHLPREESITLRAANVEGVTAWETFAVTVEPSDDAPVIAAPAALELEVGDTVDHTVSVGDFGDSLALEGSIPGLTWDGETGKLSGIAVVPGIYDLRLRGENESGFGPWVNWSVVVREVLSDAFEEYTDAAGLSGADAAYEAIPFGDGVTNLIKFAFNMDASGSDGRTLVPGSGSAGMPYSGLAANEEGTTIRIEFIRRRNSSLLYTPNFSDDLVVFQPGVGGIVSVTPIDEFYERVIWEEPIGAGVVRKFWRVEVETP